MTINELLSIYGDTLRRAKKKNYKVKYADMIAQVLTLDILFVAQDY